MRHQGYNKGEIIIYQSPKNKIELQVKLEKDTVWLTQEQIALLFEIQRPAITKHLLNIFKTGELVKKSVCSVLEHTAADGKKYRTAFYDLDAIISVGYRVNSKRATQFRIWATRTLKDHLVRGYTVNKKRLLQTKKRLNELRGVVNFIEQKSSHQLLSGYEKGLLKILADYSKALTLLERFDQNKTRIYSRRKTKIIITYEEAIKIVHQLKQNLISKKEASNLFGQEYGERFRGILANIYQTFENKDLYPSLEEKAANLIYLLIKDHPFVDGNKRIASVLFIYFLNLNKYLFRRTGERKINDNALVTLALLIAASNPKEKDKVVDIIVNLIAS